MDQVEGLLHKYTNVVKGWQYRWFILKPEVGLLEYYLATHAEEAKSQRPRGCLHLAGVVVSPSDEDSNTFIVNAANGEAFKLRGVNAKERQGWVDKLRAVAELHTRIRNNADNVSRESSIRSISTGPLSTDSQQQQQQQQQQLSLADHQNQDNKSKQVVANSFVESSDTLHHTKSVNAMARVQHRVMENTRSIYDAFSAAQEILMQAECGHHALAKAIEDLPSVGPDVRGIDPDVLLLKATSQATLLCLKQCHAMLQQQQQATSFSQTGVTGGAMMEWMDPFSYSLNWNNINLGKNMSTNDSNLPLSFITDNEDNVDLKSEDEVSESDEVMELDMGSGEEQRTVTLQLLSQLKLGMDMTRVVLPAFLLEPRSLLEMFADFMRHPDIFARIPKEENAEARIMTVVEWYLTAFHFGRKEGTAKKPYNPILGELFFCSWNLSRPQQCTDDDITSSSSSSSSSSKGCKFKFVAEQVSHHPPISAFYIESSNRDVYLNAAIATKSKFMGMSVGVNILGEAVLSVPQYEEEYVITFPSAFARSILSIPWIELCGKVVITCNKSGYSTSITFHAKPFSGGKSHHVTAEVKNGAGQNVCKVEGEWNGVLEFIYANGERKLIDTSTLSVYRKRIRPLNLQSRLESRCVWQDVTKAIRDENMVLASKTKRVLEECQQYRARQRKETGNHFAPRYFQMIGGTWTSRF